MKFKNLKTGNIIDVNNADVIKACKKSKDFETVKTKAFTKKKEAGN